MEQPDRRNGDAGSPDAVAASLGEWRTGEGPLYRRLASALAATVHRGVLLTGDLLPAERHLSNELEVSRSTVVAAYAELRARGLATTKRGSGTVLVAPGPERVPPRVFAAGLLRRAGDQDRLADLTVGAPRCDELVAELVDGVDVRASMGHHGYRPFGVPELCAAIAARMSAAGVATSPEEILVTAGAQEGLSLLATEFGAGRTVVSETPTYSGAVGAFQAAGAGVVTVPRDDEGPRADDLDAVLRRETAVGFVYLGGSCHTPTGIGVSDARRVELLAVAAEHGVRVVEDISVDDMRFVGGGGTPLWQRDPERVVAVGSLSKVVWPGLRVGWLRAPRAVLDRLLERRAAWSIGVSIPSQLVALAALGDLERIAMRRRAEARRKMGLALDVLADEIPEWPAQPADGGWSLWFAVPGGDAAGFAQLARRRGVLVAPGGSSGLAEEHPGHLRVATALPEAELERALGVLARAWDEHLAGRRR